MKRFNTYLFMTFGLLITFNAFASGGGKLSDNITIRNWLKSRKNQKVCSEFINLQKKLDKHRSSAKNLITRIEALNNASPTKTKAHQFFRAWPNMTHHFLKSQASLHQIEELLKLKGEILADVHVENFGFISDDNNQNGMHVIFGVNDFDEAGFGAYAADLIRLYGSTLLADGLEGEQVIGENDSKCLLESYQTGLDAGVKLSASACDKEGGEHEFPSKHVKEKLLELNAEYLAVENNVYLKDVEDYIKNGDKYLFSEKQKNEDGDYCSLGTQKQDEALRFFKEANPKIVFMDSYARCKKLGGSGGLGRSVNLVKDIDGKIKILELKQVSKFNAPRVWNSLRNGRHHKKLENAIDLFVPELKEELSLFTYSNGKGKRHYLKRYATLAKSSFKPFKIVDTKKGEEYKYKKKKIRKMLSDQFYSLGLFHRASLLNPRNNPSNNRISRIDKLKDQVDGKKIISTAGKLVEYYQKFYEACQ